MNREILFRGKRIDNGEWAEGDVCRSARQIYIHPHHNSFRVTKEGLSKLLVMHEVDPATIGQYTGLTDKNGQRIFEGDIVRYTFDSPDDPTATENGLIPRIGRIFWSDWRAAFAVTAGRNGSAALNNDVARYVRGRSIYEYVRGANTVEVIGNIHDGEFQ